VGVYAEVGKTTATSGAELAQRYAAIAAHPDAEVGQISGHLQRLALDAALRAALIGLLAPGLWLLLGPRRRHDLVHARPRALVAVVGLVGIGVVLLVEPWHGSAERVEDESWLPIEKALPELTVPAELRGWQLEGGLVTAGTQRLVQSAFDTYAESKVFYRDVVHAVPGVAGELHEPTDAQTVALLVSDRHDNIGMDAVARAIGDAGSATVVLDAGDDTSVGQPWESFSLDSLNTTFEDYTKVAVSGNHDHGTFVNRYLAHRGWTHLDGDPVSPFGDVQVTGVDDPRSSGLGGWRDETNLTFAEVKATIGKDVCEQEKQGHRIATLLVHDANLGGTALANGCTDLVLAGHLHVQEGPTRVVGASGRAGYSYTNGTTGGAAYAVAYGSKLKRIAEVTLATYEDGRPVGLQPVEVLTTGEIDVSGYVPLDLG
jgi:hypothetical protein